MMKEDKYTEQSQFLAKAIDLAIDSIRQYPPEIWDEGTLNHVITTYREFKNKALNPEPTYRNLKSLTYIVNDVFIYFQENSGKSIEYFWTEVKKKKLPYKRENKLANILKRKKIKNRIEYDFVTDIIVPYQQEGLIDKIEIIKLNQYLADFEGRNKVSN